MQRATCTKEQQTRQHGSILVALARMSPPYRTVAALVRLCCLGCVLMPAAAQTLLDAVQHLEVAVAPGQPYHVTANEQIKFLRFSCMSGPADAVITLSSYAEHSQPLILLSLNPAVAPTLQMHDGSSFTQWREDNAGDHYLHVRGVSPAGGVIGIVDVKRFANEEFDGILRIKCMPIVVFDTLFWDHLRSEAVCPAGVAQTGKQARTTSGAKDGSIVCSGHGGCGKDGRCICSGEYTGPACEHSKIDIVVKAQGKYSFAIAAGRYQYFRVRIPPRFPGGFLELQLTSDAPLILLARNGDLPTKTSFELSNFDDWINNRNTSSLKFPVSPSEDVQQHAIPSVLHPQLPEGAPATTCSKKSPMLQNPTCRLQGFLQCETSCLSCLECVKSGVPEDPCTSACTLCKHPLCVDMMSLCAGNMSCSGPEARSCQVDCGSCLNCFESNDKACHGCQCCGSCLPIAAKCNVLTNHMAESSRYVFVGVYNHRHYYNEKKMIQAHGQVKLLADAMYEDKMTKTLPKSWTAELYDPFRTIQTLESTQHDRYPEGEQFIYTIVLGSFDTVPLKVNIFRDRLTLIHVDNTANSAGLELRFAGGPAISHILTSTRAAPKTLFDFNKQHTMQQGSVRIDTERQKHIWCAIFAAADGEIAVTASTLDSQPTSSGRVGFALFCILALLCGLMVLGCVYGNVHKLGDSVGMDTSIPLSERFQNLIRMPASHESTASLTRANSISSYVGGDSLDPTVEDQYLNRGGFGDDGI